MKISCVLVPVLAAVASTVGANHTNATIARASIESVQCIPGSGSVSGWYYNSKSEGPYLCKFDGDKSAWSMLMAYRSGGQEGVHWKYTDYDYDGDCLLNWKYYSSDGQTLIADIHGRTTKQGDSGKWCPLKVYRSGGIEGMQWGRCMCSDYWS